MDCRMQREIADIVLEAVYEIADLPETLVDALMEGAYALTGGTRQFRPLTAEETDAVVGYLRGNAARAGIPFDEMALRADIAKHPGRYQVTLANIRKRREMPSAAERNMLQRQMDERKTADAANKAKRFTYYAAVVDRLKKSFSYFNIPFDAARAMEDIARDDARWLAHVGLRDAVKDPYFRSLGDAAKDPSVSYLRMKNPTLAKYMTDAFKFSRMTDDGIESMKNEYRYMRPDVSGEAADVTGREPDGKSTGNREFDDKIAPWYSKSASLSDVVAKCKDVPYDYICRYFIEHGGADRVKDAPRTGEDIVEYLRRLPRGDRGELEFTAELNRLSEAAFGRGMVDGAVRQVERQDPARFQEMVKKCSRSLVKPKDIPLYAAWCALHSN